MAYVYSNGEGAWIGYINNTKPGGSSGDVLIEIDSIGNKRNLYEHNGVSWALNRTADNEGPIVDDVSSVNSPLSVEFESYKADNATQFRVPNVYKSVNFFAHRGARMIAPENTIHAFEKAGMLKYWGIETDIQQTSDGVWVIYHDTTLDTMSDGTGAIKYKTLAEIKALNITVGVNLAYYPNSKIPTLEEYLVICKKYGVTPVIEDKVYFTQAQADSVVAVLRKNNMLEKAIITSYNPTSLLYIRNASKVLQTALALDSWVDTNIQVMLDNGIDIAGISSGSCTQVAVELCHSNNISVATFTLNTMANIKTFIARGVDFIYSDSINGEVT